MWSRAVVRTRHRCPRGRSNYAGRMLLAEELILLLLDDDSGRWLVRRRAVRQAVRVALVFELVADRDTREPLGADRMKAVHAACVARGVWPLVMGNRVHVVPPCVISHDDAGHAVSVLADALQEVTV